MRAGLVALLMCGCGRAGFDAIGRASDGSVDDAENLDVPSDAITPICHTGTWSASDSILATVTGSEEVDPALSPDELTLYFESNRPPSMARAIWVCTRSSRTVPFGAPVRVQELDSAMDDYDPSISADGNTIYFGSLRSGIREIYSATREDVAGPFVVDPAIGIVGDAMPVRSAPKLTPDGLTLYYARDLDVAVASRATPTTDFTFERELDEVNAPPTDGSPTVTPDGLELFFDSYRNGPAAVFKASRTDTASSFSGLTELTALPMMVVGGIAAGTPEISADGRTLYYFVNNGSGLDLYQSTRTCP